jgi:hypothetical protein
MRQQVSRGFAPSARQRSQRPAKPNGRADDVRSSRIRIGRVEAWVKQRTEKV